ncbi:MAG: Protein of unknown function (DUF1469) [Rhodobacteraceae bacterium HLUCCA12]|nr:MAG: Protein of unknown function (DUF1469) [Rhodobacteraceae bacterium HLUCCA12]
MLPPLAEVRHVARGTARRTAFLVAGGALVLVGGGFLVAALWIVLEQVFDVFAATIAVAGLMLGLGLIVIAIAPRQPRLAGPEKRLRARARAGQLYQPNGAFPPVAEAFLFGLAVAAQIRNRRR